MDFWPRGPLIKKNLDARVIWWHTIQHLRGRPQIANILWLISFPRSKANITRIESFCNYLTSKGQNWKNVRIHTNTKKQPQLWLYNERILYVTEGAMMSQNIIAPMLRKWPPYCRRSTVPMFTLCYSYICMSLWIGLLWKRLCNAVNYKWCLSLCISETTTMQTASGVEQRPRSST